MSTIGDFLRGMMRMVKPVTNAELRGLLHRVLENQGVIVNGIDHVIRHEHEERDTMSAQYEEFSADVQELATAVADNATATEDLATRISNLPPASEITDADLDALRSAVTGVQSNSARIATLAQSAPEIPTDGGDGTGSGDDSGDGSGDGSGEPV
jgi:methyl-accepting chemotaxis protein